MIKYTKGPWKAGPTEERELPGSLIERTIPVYIYDTNHKQPKWSGGHPHPVIAQVWWHHDEAEANARLIAAAPEMLEALKQITAAFSRYLSGSETKLYEITQARAAIAKAGGAENERGAG